MNCHPERSEGSPEVKTKLKKPVISSSLSYPKSTAAAPIKNTNQEEWNSFLASCLPVFSGDHKIAG
jgi:hypothetical protein